jgi:small subunit ribosomal protein S16
MPVRLRFAMHGIKKQKILHLVAIDTRKRRDARPIETLGIYSPRLQPGADSKTVQWAVERIKYWLDVGAQPSKPVVRLLTLVRRALLPGWRLKFET